MQPLIRTLGLRVTFDSSATKPAPTGSRDTDVHGRQVSRGQDNDSRPASRSRGGREGSSVRETSNRMPRQEGGCPTGVPHNIPLSSTPGNPSPQLGSITRASPRNPLKNLAHYRSAGWKKDLGHILGSFYHYNYPSHKEVERKKLKTKFFEYLGQHQEEWRAIKEEKPLQYMPYMESHFQALTSIRLKGLSQFTGWIKPGSYYHGVVARKGQLHMCLHLAGTELPNGLQIHPSQTHSVTQKEEETPTTSLHMPGKEGSMTQGAHSDSPAPMETGGVGDGQSWVEQAEASDAEEWRRGRPAKHHRSASRKWEGWSTNPFPLQDSKGRREVVQQLYRHAGELTLTRHDVAAQGMARHLRRSFNRSWLRTGTRQRVHWTMSRGSRLNSKESLKTSLRLTEWSLTNLLKRRLREIWNGSGKTSKVSRSSYLIINPTSEGPRFNQKKPRPVKTIHPTLGSRVLKRWRWLLHR